MVLPLVKARGAVAVPTAVISFLREEWAMVAIGLNLSSRKITWIFEGGPFSGLNLVRTMRTEPTSGMAMVGCRKVNSLLPTPRSGRICESAPS